MTVNFDSPCCFNMPPPPPPTPFCDRNLIQSESSSAPKLDFDTISKRSLLGDFKKRRKDFDEIDSPIKPSLVGTGNHVNMIFAVGDFDVATTTGTVGDSSVFTKRRRLSNGRSSVLNLAPRFKQPKARTLIPCARERPSHQNFPICSYSSSQRVLSPCPTLIPPANINQVSFRSPSKSTPLRPPGQRFVFSPPPPPTAPSHEKVLRTGSIPILSPGAANWWTKEGKDDLKKYLDEKSAARFSNTTIETRRIGGKHGPKVVSKLELSSLDPERNQKNSTCREQCHICSQNNCNENTPKISKYFSTKTSIHENKIRPRNILDSPVPSTESMNFLQCTPITPPRHVEECKKMYLLRQNGMCFVMHCFLYGRKV
uniref:Uncharacterized protein n=1 Tax=Corethron hystrix TaxID=216773 RepID=A0A7S1BD42_9STRA|mmetsp:Transcript_20801/g.47220  ORF Transcript_20801/g.47220 Transcript_20801/m.47220 type:complete len:370 (+) Transcript_20801:357-1466(+)